MTLLCLKVKEISTERTPAAGVMRWNSRVEIIKEFTRRRSVYIYSAVAVYRLALGKYHLSLRLVVVNLYLFELGAKTSINNH